MACCILGALIIASLLFPARKIKGTWYKLRGMELPDERSRAVNWQP